MWERRDQGRPAVRPGDIAAPEVLLITKSDIDGVGPSTPYGAVLAGGRRSSGKTSAGVTATATSEQISPSEARHQIHDLQAPHLAAGQARASTTRRHTGDRADTVVERRLVRREPTVVSITRLSRLGTSSKRTRAAGSFAPTRSRTTQRPQLPRLAGQLSRPPPGLPRRSPAEQLGQPLDVRTEDLVREDSRAAGSIGGRRRPP